MIPVESTSGGSHFLLLVVGRLAVIDPFFYENVGIRMFVFVNGKFPMGLIEFCSDHYYERHVLHVV